MNKTSKVKIELHKTLFGFDQDATVEVENKSDGVHITVLKATFPALINHNVICRLVNDHRGEYDSYCHTMQECKNSANNGFLDYEIATLKERLKRAEFAKLVAKRNKIFVHDKTESLTGE